MERASSFLYERQSPRSREREEQLRTEMPTTTLARRIAGALGVGLSDERAGTLGTVIHYGFGASGGPVAAALSRGSLAPLPAGLAVGTGMWVLADEGANTALGLTPPPREFPLVTHARALLAHVVYGLSLGALVALTRRISRR